MKSDETRDKMAPVVAVVGGGVVGLTTAVKLQQQIPAVSVRIISDQWSPDITRSRQQSPYNTRGPDDFLHLIIFHNTEGRAHYIFLGRVFQDML